MTEITFPPIETENPARETIDFKAYKDNLVIECAVTYRALADHFDASYSDPLFAFMTGRPTIESLVCDRIPNEVVDKDSVLLLDTFDFEHSVPA